VFAVEDPPTHVPVIACDAVPAAANQPDAIPCPAALFHRS
jgi:hypothetical protein